VEPLLLRGVSTSPNACPGWLTHGSSPRKGSIFAELASRRRAVCPSLPQ
jgi:hypothetical protein